MAELTTEKLNKINELTEAVKKAQEIYNIELRDNQIATDGEKIAGQTANTPGVITTLGGYSGNYKFWYDWKVASDASLKAKKQSLDSAAANLENYKNAINLQSTVELNAAFAKNPMLAADLAKIEAQKQLDEKKLFAQKTTKYLIFGTIALVVIVVAVIIYKKKFAA